MLEKYLATPNERQCYYLYYLHSIELMSLCHFNIPVGLMCIRVCSGVAHSLGFLRAMVQKLHLSYLKRKMTITSY